MSNKSHIKRTGRIRYKLKRINTERFRLTIFRSSRNISAQIIDSKNNKTLVSASSVSKKKENKKKADKSLEVAQILLKKALEKKITTVYFDRGGYKYHGRIKSFAEVIRKGGLRF
jgi:large subunit ribosomal protein L18